MDPPSRVQSFYHSAMMPITWLCTLSEEEDIFMLNFNVDACKLWSQELVPVPAFISSLLRCPPMTPFREMSPLRTLE